MTDDNHDAPSPAESDPAVKRGDLAASLADSVGDKAARKLRARQRPTRVVWFGLGMMGLVGWSVAMPTVAGIALGVWLDRRFPGMPSYTLTFLLVGLVLGCVNAWRWVSRENSEIAREEKQSQKEQSDKEQGHE